MHAFQYNQTVDFTCGAHSDIEMLEKRLSVLTSAVHYIYNFVYHNKAAQIKFCCIIHICQYVSTKFHLLVPCLNKGEHAITVISHIQNILYCITLVSTIDLID